MTVKNDKLVRVQWEDGFREELHVCLRYSGEFFGYRVAEDPDTLHIIPWQRIKELEFVDY